MLKMIMLLFSFFLSACGVYNLEISKLRPDKEPDPKVFDNLLPNKVVRNDLSSPSITNIRNLTGTPLSAGDHNETGGFVVDANCTATGGAVFVVTMLKSPGAPDPVKLSVQSAPCDTSGSVNQIINMNHGEFGELLLKVTQERSSGSEDISPYETSITMISSLPLPTVISIVPNLAEPNGGINITIGCKEGEKYVLDSSLMFLGEDPEPKVCPASNIIVWTVPPSSISLTDTAIFDFIPLDRNDSPFPHRAMSRSMPEVLAPPVLTTASLGGPGNLDVTGQCKPNTPVELLVTEPGGGTKTSMRVNCSPDGVMAISFPPGGYDPASAVQVMHYLDASGIRSQLSNSVLIN
ncbi:hypothetical protein [Bdellovibrio sp. BCCA]|uniref:hypothetical protein n=1 Tax=Bdellovibrio sp. BCCA TaxID=3136281 RepID=UPI0030F354DB